MRDGTVDKKKPEKSLCIRDKLKIQEIIIFAKFDSTRPMAVIVHILYRDHAVQVDENNIITKFIVSTQPADCFHDDAIRYLRGRKT